MQLLDNRGYVLLCNVTKSILAIQTQTFHVSYCSDADPHMCQHEVVLIHRARLRGWLLRDSATTNRIQMTSPTCILISLGVLDILIAQVNPNRSVKMAQIKR